MGQGANFKNLQEQTGEGKHCGRNVYMELLVVVVVVGPVGNVGSPETDSGRPAKPDKKVNANVCARMDP